MRYLGNKTKLGGWIADIIGSVHDAPIADITVYDACAGTGAIAQCLGARGYKVVSSDVNAYAHSLAHSRTMVTRDTVLSHTLTLRELLDMLNAETSEGYVCERYSPGGEAGRKYFTKENAVNIDGARARLSALLADGSVTQDGYTFLLGCLIECVSLVSNIPGTYGAFNRIWDPRALKPFRLTEEVANTLWAPRRGTACHHADAASLVAETECNVLYLDPPYNARDYATYYHVLEAIARYDGAAIKPNKTGTPLAPVARSAWCIKARAAAELEMYVSRTRATVVALSYNDEGLISDDVVRDTMSKYGEYSVHETDYRRFKCTPGQAHTGTKERLHVLVKAVQPKLQRCRTQRYTSPTAWSAWHRYLLTACSWSALTCLTGSPSVSGTHPSISSACGLSTGGYWRLRAAWCCSASSHSLVGW
jgi:adenine-specific DNA-methyltransferase